MILIFFCFIEDSLPLAMILGGDVAKGNPNVALRHSRFFVSIHLCKQKQQYQDSFNYNCVFVKRSLLELLLKEKTRKA